MNNFNRNEFEKYNTEIHLKKDWVFPYAQVQKGTSIILYGAGDVGQSYFCQVNANGYCEIVHWVDRDYKNYQDYGFNVESLGTISGCNYDYVVIAVADSCIAREINNHLLEQGVCQDRIVWNTGERYLYKGDIKGKRLIEPAVACLASVLEQRSIRTDSGQGKRLVDDVCNAATNGFVIPRLVVELTTACTLKCKHCNNLIPKLKPRNVDVDKVKENILSIIDASDKIIILELIGGEPFLYPQLKDVLELVLKQDKIFEVEITTNGTLLPNEELLSLLKNPKVVVHISRYETSCKANELEKLLFDENIRYVQMDELAWIDSGGVENRHRSDEQIQNEYWNCQPSYTCKTLFDGRVYACARSASLYEMGVLTDSSGYVAVDSRDSLRNELMDFWLRISDRACNHCDAADAWRIIKAGEQI